MTCPVQPKKQRAAPRQRLCARDPEASAGGSGGGGGSQELFSTPCKKEKETEKRRRRNSRSRSHMFGKVQEPHIKHIK